MREGDRLVHKLVLDEVVSLVLKLILWPDEFCRMVVKGLPRLGDGESPADADPSKVRLPLPRLSPGPELLDAG